MENASFIIEGGRRLSGEIEIQGAKNSVLPILAAAVLCAHILPAMQRGVWRRVLFAGTGALLSPTSCQQGCSIPGICHAAAIEWEG